jgi:very-short-patch-repair endonuclease
MDLDVATLVASGKYGVMTLADADAQGVGRFEVARLVRQGRLVRLVDGTFTDAERWHACTPEGRHALRAVSVVRVLRTAVAISHISAAAVLGLPLLRPPGERVHVSRLTEGAGRTRSVYTMHTSYGDCSVVAARRPSVVVPALAALGVAEVHGFTAGVVALDGALQSSMTTEEECRRWLDGMPHRPGVRLLRRALAAADGLSESPLETRARLVVRALGFDVALQVRLYNEHGEFVARVDMLAFELGVVIEVDGAVKYTRPDGSASVESVISEKHREGAVRDLGYGLVRLDHRSLENPEQIRQRIHAAARRASPSLRRAPADAPSLLRAPAVR